MTKPILQATVLTHGKVLSMISAARVFIQRKEDPRGREGAAPPAEPTLGNLNLSTMLSNEISPLHEL